MKKLKIVLMTVVVSIAISGAFASKASDFCDINPQYYKLGFNYFEAGTIGVNYFCIQGGATCTYWKPNPAMEPNAYVPCKTGYYFRIIY